MAGKHFSVKVGEGSRVSSREPTSGLSAAGIVIGVIGCVIITASSVYTALKMGALPWPTIFTSVTALVLLHALGHRSLNEANATQIIMSAGSMVAGGLAFTIPGIWMLGLADDVNWLQMLMVALAGTLLGLVCTALIRRRLVEESELEYPIGVAAAQTLKASEAGGATGAKLALSMPFAGAWSVARDVVPKALGYLGDGSASRAERKAARSANPFLLLLLTAGSAALVHLGLGLSLRATALILALGFVTTIMSAQSVGQTGIDPMEIFGLIVLLAVAALGERDQERLFFVAGIIAVACGLGGDVMSDFKTGQLIGTSPRQMWVGQAIGALLGTVVSVAVMVALAGAYGTDAFGPGKLFVSAQASVVATMVSGIPSLPFFVVGLVAGVALHCLGLPSMMLGLGVYLPFYMSLSAPIGALAKLVYDKLAGGRGGELGHDDTGIIVASGLLGGESIEGVVIALATVVAGLMG